MIDRILEFSLRQRAVVALFAVALLGVGLWSALHLPIDEEAPVTSSLLCCSLPTFTTPPS